MSTNDEAKRRALYEKAMELTMADKVLIPIVNLQAVSESLSASRSRIQDADFAAETASLTRAQILQQAGISVLSQANAQPQLALSLLQ